MEAFLRDPAVGWDYARMVHGEQSFTMHRPLYAGDEVVITLHVDELRTRGGSLFLTLRSEVADTAGEPGADGRLAVRHRRSGGGAGVTAAVPVRRAPGDALAAARDAARISSATRARPATSTRSTGASGSRSAWACRT